MGLFKRAFTLSEVLITLGIIGVIAAITIPGILTTISWNVRKTQYKKAVSVMNEALKRVYEKTDTIYSCYYGHDYAGNYIQGPGDQCGELAEQMKQVLQISHICRGKAYQNGCIPKYKGFDTALKENDENMSDDEVANITRGCGSFKESAILNNNTAMVLLDGTIIGIYGSLDFNKIFFIDINGKQKPNKWGYDVFAFMIMSDDTKLYLKQGGCSIREKGGKFGYQMMQ